MNQETFVSVMNPKNKLIYTSAENKYSYNEFIECIYDGLHKVFEETDIIPSLTKALTSKQKSIRFDKQLNLSFL